MLHAVFSKMEVKNVLKERTIGISLPCSDIGVNLIKVNIRTRSRGRHGYCAPLMPPGLISGLSVVVE